MLQYRPLDQGRVLQHQFQRALSINVFAGGLRKSAPGRAACVKQFLPLDTSSPSFEVSFLKTVNTNIVKPIFHRIGIEPFLSFSASVAVQDSVNSQHAVFLRYSC